jgi:phosphoglycolate phosphatase-like HAD superfamily hydrolase
MTDTVEVIRDRPTAPCRAAIFDFDGTLSLLRRNWQDVMIPMMVDILADTATDETRDQLNATVEEFVMRLNGRQTIYQMIRLAEEVSRRGGQPCEPLEYKHQYHDRLWQEVGARVEAVRTGAISAQVMTVPGTRELLESLQRQGIALYLASGTDLKYVQDEVQVLGLADYFGEHVYGALDDYRQFSKAMIVERIIRETQMPGKNLVGFGDGFVEIEEVARVGGLAIGVASNEDTRKGVNAWKRQRLIQAGAHLIIGDYRGLPELLAAMGLSG